LTFVNLQRRKNIFLFCNRKQQPCKIIYLFIYLCIMARTGDRRDDGRNNRPNSSSSNETPIDTSPKWLQAIQIATEGLFFGNTTGHGRSSTTTTIKDPKEALRYLISLEETLLTIPTRKWNHTPKVLPPKPTSFDDSDAQNDNDHSAPPLQQQQANNTQTRSSFAASNPYAAFLGGDDEDDDDKDTSSSSSSSEYDDEAGDTIILPHEGAAKMVIRRILLRILASQSDVYGRLAQDAVFSNTNIKQEQQNNNHRDRSEWLLGAEHCTLAVHILHRAVLLADEQISKWLSSQQHHHQPQDQALLLQALGNDADIISISLQHFSGKDGQFRKAAEKQKSRLESRLYPQWEERDAVKSRLGDRWTNNPNPKFDYAAKRQADENELRELERALIALDELNDAKRVLELSVRQIQDQLHQASGGEGGEINVHSNTTSRYNEIRPVDVSQRVSWDDYPDATEFGWTFTGSNELSRVEFFERLVDSHVNNGGQSSSTTSSTAAAPPPVLVKLDWYYTTATVKTSMDHPKQGPNQLFGAQVTPQVYIQILQNPRSHTDVRYHTRRSSGNNHSSNNRNRNRNRGNDDNNNRGRGRGGGRSGQRRRGRGRGDGAGRN
jgi:hypothetical protein